MSKYKVLFISNYPSPYRVDFWNLLGKQVDLTVTFTSAPAEQHHRSQKWFNTDYSGFHAIFLKKRRKFLGNEVCFDIIDIVKEHFDFIILGGYSNPTNMLAIEYLRLHKIPFILEADGGLIQSESIIKHLIKKHFISGATAWMSSGKPTAEYFVHYGAKADRIYNYPFTSQWKKDIDNAYSLTQEEKADLRKQLDMKENKIVISVGRFSYQDGYGKGFDTLCEVAKNLSPSIGVYIIGDEPTEEFKQIAKDIPNLHFIAFKQKDELADYYAASDVFVLLTRNDVWGLVINEAMSFGLPIITTNRCGAGLSLVEEGVNGFIVPTNDSQTVLRCLERLFSDHDLMYSISAANRLKINSYTIESMAQSHMDAFKRGG